MDMAKIPKNLSDTAMFGDYKETLTFENENYAEETATPQPVRGIQKDNKNYANEFFTPELQEKVGKALLELKVKLYKEGIVDFDIKVTTQDKQIILTGVPSKAEKKKAK
jgi:hypothetical protein